MTATTTGRERIDFAAIREGDRVTGRNGLGGVFTIRVENIREIGAEGRRFHGRIENHMHRDWHGTEWAFGEGDVVAHHGRAA